MKHMGFIGLIPRDESGQRGFLDGLKQALRLVKTEAEREEPRITDLVALLESITGSLEGAQARRDLGGKGQRFEP